MQSILNEISILREGRPIVLDRSNTNRYRLVLQESDGSRTAYYFSTPIYNQKDRKLVDIKFRSDGENICGVGSNANITVSEKILMKNAEGTCYIGLPQKPALISEKRLKFNKGEIFPTVNGVAVMCDVKETSGINFIVEVDKPFLNVRANDKCFALMKEKFSPFVVFSCIGAFDAAGNLIAPATIVYQKPTEKKYSLTVSSASPMAQSVLLEANLYENKLFQDTTVESNNSSVNNAFGSMGFIGNTALYGQQWLYSRPDYSKMSEIMDKRVNKAVLHMPKLNSANVELSAFKAISRFCSFGSNWNNKVSGGTVVSDSSTNNGYQSLDLTALLVDPRTRTFSKTEGLILKPKIKDVGFSAVSTGDCYFAPQILEINFR